MKTSMRAATIRKMTSVDCRLFVDVEGLNGFGWFCFGIGVGVGADVDVGAMWMWAQ